MTAYVYTLPGCEACERAKALVRSQGLDAVEVPIDNPLVEAGVQMCFRDHAVHAPVVVVPGQGIYVPTRDEPMILLRIVNLQAGAGAAVAAPAAAAGE